MSTLVWSVVTTVEGRVPVASEVFCFEGPLLANLNCVQLLCVYVLQLTNELENLSLHEGMLV